ncbi:MAG: 2-dehydro-3-deoxygalactonokinase [Chitinophagaceae bacterium]|nr:2-dehydro-3-deoxygalactonokinase [Chitinophagaceae bacterium]
MNTQILSCDWGTSNFRLRWIDVSTASVISEVSDSIGIASVYNEWLKSGLPENGRSGYYRKILFSRIKQLANDPMKGIPVILSGMSSSSIGAMELPCKKVPVALDSAHLYVQHIAPDECCPHELLLVSGVQSGNDIMRGEETMLLGSANAATTGRLVILPGTHSKHVTVNGNSLVSFKTYMTGEFFDLLSRTSILSRSVAANSKEHWDIFEKGVRDGASGNLLNAAFHVRTAQLFAKFTNEENYHYLSGILIGNELSAISADTPPVLLICNSAFREKYSRALTISGITDEVEYLDAAAALVRGHCQIAKHYIDR